MTQASSISARYAKGVRVAVVLAGGLILLAGFQKLMGVTDLSPTLAFFRVPGAWHRYLTVGVAMLELVLGAGIVCFQLRSRILLSVSIAVLLCFTGIIAVLLTSAKAPSCGCLKVLAEFSSARLNNVISLGRNVLLLGVMTAAVALSRRLPASGHVSRGRK